MLSPHAERVIRRAVLAQRAYWALVTRAADDQRYKLALFDRHIAMAREANGERARKLPVLDFARAPLKQVVDHELAQLRPAVEIRVTFQRAAKRLARRCGLVQLELSYMARIRRKLRELIQRSGLTQREWADAIGVDDATVERHLAGGPIPHARAAWYDRIRAVYQDEHGLHFVVSRPAPSRRKRRKPAK